MRSIWKYQLRITDAQKLEIPTGFRIRHVAPAPLLEWDKSPRDEMVNLWVEVDPNAERVPIIFYIVGTGHPLPPTGIYIGTAPMPSGLVWHVFLWAA